MDEKIRLCHIAWADFCAAVQCSGFFSSRILMAAAYSWSELGKK